MHRYRGKIWSDTDLERIRGIIAAAPDAKRAKLSRLVCEAFEWRMRDGQLKLMSCRVAMLRMHDDGLIQLPASQRGAIDHSKLKSATYTSAASDPPKSVLEISVGDLKDLRLELVAKGKPLRLWNEFISRYHYLGYGVMPGAQLRYFIKSGDQILGAMGFGGAAWKVAPRDTFIGWSASEREKNLHLIVNQTRFLILPWVRCQNLASKSLAMAKKRIGRDWQERYAYSPVLLETFVDTTKFHGTCYKADNWTCVGLTQGRTRNDRFNTIKVPIKSIWVFPLTRRFRQELFGTKSDLTTKSAPSP